MARTDELAQLADQAQSRADPGRVVADGRQSSRRQQSRAGVVVPDHAAAGGEESRCGTRAERGARMRVQAIASAHRKLRLGADFATVKVNEVLGAVLEDISAGLAAGRFDPNSLPGRTVGDQRARCGVARAC